MSKRKREKDLENDEKRVEAKGVTIVSGSSDKDGEFVDVFWQGARLTDRQKNERYMEQ